ncbi:ligand-binding protein SH3 [Lysobacteraceae bacterium NML120232]|nr:ligand-binding protein SH3 [Xanthomonadaceae bacterium NML08-0793]PJK13594.1 ligand-binding protein SH3 [Xanthomonadaceae bacterium NML120232]
MRKLTALALATALLLSAPAMAGEYEDQRAREAVRVLNENLEIPESAIPDKLFDEARGIVVVPDTVKAGLIFGGRRGLGLMSVKTTEGTWSNPVFVKLVGGSFGFQAGVQASDIIMVIRNDRGVQNIVNGKFTLGVDAAAAAGPVGRNASAMTDAQFKAEIWSWSRSRGLFAGVALDGAVLKIDDEANQAVYGHGVTPRMIFENRAPQPGSSATVAMRDALEEASATARNRRNPAEEVPVYAPTEQYRHGQTPPPAAPAQPAQPAAPQNPPQDGGVVTTPLPPID